MPGFIECWFSMLWNCTAYSVPSLAESRGRADSVSLDFQKVFSNYQFTQFLPSLAAARVVTPKLSKKRDFGVNFHCLPCQKCKFRGIDFSFS